MNTDANKNYTLKDNTERKQFELDINGYTARIEYIIMAKKLQTAVAQFASEKGITELVEKFRGYYGAKASKSTDLRLSDMAKEINEDLNAAVAKLSGLPVVEGVSKEAYLSSPQYQWATFAVIGALIDAVLPDALVDSIGLYTDIRFGGFGDTAMFKIDTRDLFVVTKGGKGNRSGEIKKQFKGNVAVNAEEREITVGESLYRILCGEADLADLAMKAAKALEVQMTRDAYAAFATAMNALPNSGNGQLRVAGYTQDDVIKLAQKVSAWNGGREVIIAGTQLALSKVLPANSNFRFDLESEYVKMGFISNPFGFKTFLIPQVAAYETEFTTAIADNRLYILCPSADKLVKGFVEGTTLTFVSGVNGYADLTQESVMKKFYGFAVATSAISGVIELA